jgi:glycosyltransferase involved in cell wall biosynthesis
MNASRWWFEQTIRTAHDSATECKPEFLVFSNCHRQETGESIKGLKDAGVNITLVAFSPRNEGVAIAVNECAARATGDLVGYSDDDRIFLPGWDKALLDKWTGHESEYLYLTSRAIEPTGTNPCMVAPHGFGRDAKTFDAAALAEFWKNLPKSDVVSCAGPPFCSAWLWKKVGYFDAGYFPGFGTDGDFVARIFQAAKDNGTRANFIGIGRFGTYHGQCLSTSLVRTDGATLASHIRFRNKFGLSTRDFSQMVGDGTPLE